MNSIKLNTSQFKYTCPACNFSQIIKMDFTFHDELGHNYYQFNTSAPEECPACFGRFDENKLIENYWYEQERKNSENFY